MSSKAFPLNESCVTSKLTQDTGACSCSEKVEEGEGPNLDKVWGKGGTNSKGRPLLLSQPKPYLWERGAHCLLDPRVTPEPQLPPWDVHLREAWRSAAELKQSPRGASVLQNLYSLLYQALTRCLGLGISELKTDIPQGKETPPSQEMDSSNFLT